MACTPTAGGCRCFARASGPDHGFRDRVRPAFDRHLPPLRGGEQNGRSQHRVLRGIESAAYLNRAQPPASRRVNASLHYIAIAIVYIGIAVGVRVAVVVIIGISVRPVKSAEPQSAPEAMAMSLREIRRRGIRRPSRRRRSRRREIHRRQNLRRGRRLRLHEPAPSSAKPAPWIPLPEMGSSFCATSSFILHQRDRSQPGRALRS